MELGGQTMLDPNVVAIQVTSNPVSNKTPS